jgi:hypothetical protein
MHTAEPLVPELSSFEIEIALEKLKIYKSPVTDQIPEPLRSELHKLINSIWNKEKLPQQREEFVIILICNKGDKTDSNNYRGISSLPTTYKMLSNILFSRLTPSVDEIIGYYQCGF